MLRSNKMVEGENRDGFGSTYLWHKRVGNGTMSVDNIERNGERRGSHCSGSSNRISRDRLLTGTLFLGITHI